MSYSNGFESIEAVQASLRDKNYIADRSLATTIFLALRLAKPLLLEGEAGVGKTEVGRVLGVRGSQPRPLSRTVSRSDTYRTGVRGHALHILDVPGFPPPDRSRGQASRE